ncbi:MAG: hypothetical protein KF752_06240 [Pirellulaceae bacterium]|nr:hypothetical protein [Pirellulaceae bacterium]
MYVLASLSLLGACLFYVGMLLLNYPEPNTAGDRVMFYGFASVVMSVGFFACLTVLAIALSSLTRLDWVSKSLSLRTALALTATVAISVSLFCAAMLRTETWETTPVWLGVLARSHAMVWIPLPALIAATLLLVAGQEPNTWTIVARFLAMGSLAMGLVFSTGLLTSWLEHSVAAQQQLLEEAQQKFEESQQEDLKRIQEFSASDSIQVLLPLAATWQDKAIRSQAIEKLKSRVDWEEELYRLLDQDHAYRDIYLFLDGNHVTDRRRFAESLERSLHKVAEEISREVQTTNNLQSWSFEWCRIDNALRAIDFQFANLGVDFVPAIQKIQAALNDHRPERFRNVKLEISTKVQIWLKKNRSR